VGNFELADVKFKTAQIIVNGNYTHKYCILFVYILISYIPARE